MIPTKIKNRSDSLDENNDCAVKAVAILTNASYDEAHKLMQKLGRKKGKATPRIVTLVAIKKLGCWISDKMECPAKTVRHLPGLLPKGRWLVVCSGHVLAVIDGKVLDWTEGRRHRPKYMWEISL